VALVLGCRYLLIRVRIEWLDTTIFQTPVLGNKVNLHQAGFVKKFWRHDIRCVPKFQAGWHACLNRLGNQLLPFRRKKEKMKIDLGDEWMK
jgi:hypothetical protein